MKRHVPLLYALLYKKLDSCCNESRTMRIGEVRKQLSRIFLGLDSGRATTVMTEMAAFQLLSIDRYSVTLNRVSVPDI